MRDLNKKNIKSHPSTTQGHEKMLQLQREEEERRRREEEERRRREEEERRRLAEEVREHQNITETALGSSSPANSPSLPHSRVRHAARRLLLSFSCYFLFFKAERERLARLAEAERLRKEEEERARLAALAEAERLRRLVNTSFTSNLPIQPPTRPPTHPCLFLLLRISSFCFLELSRSIHLSSTRSVHPPLCHCLL